MLLSMIRVRVCAFGVLKDTLGSDGASVALRDGATVGDLLAQLQEVHPAGLFRGIAVSVNAEYAVVSKALVEGDEVGLLPPVSGGAMPTPTTAGRAADMDEGCLRADFVRLTRERIDAQSLIAAAKWGDDGAVVVFDGIVRNNSRGRRTLYLEYEAYEAMAQKQLEELASTARERFGVRRVAVAHRLGRLQIGETSVLIVVASAHRAEAFDACRWLIDTLKKTVPIWKKETFVDGAVWADGEPFPVELCLGDSDAQ
jgi:molybdopterin synthase catalytic subunit